MSYDPGSSRQKEIPSSKIYPTEQGQPLRVRTKMKPEVQGGERQVRTDRKCCRLGKSSRFKPPWTIEASTVQ